MGNEHILTLLTMGVKSFAAGYTQETARDNKEPEREIRNFMPHTTN